VLQGNLRKESERWYYKRDWCNYYNREVARLRKEAKVEEVVTVDSLPSKKQGKPPLLGANLDTHLQRHEVTRDRDRHKCCYCCWDWCTNKTYWEEATCGETKQGCTG